MFSYKKILFRTTVIFIAFTLLSGCKGQDNASQSAASDTSAGVQTQEIDLSNSAILGNSYADGFVTYNVLPDTDVFYRVGLNVRTAFTKPMLNHDIPVIEELDNDKTYDRVFLLFGENELGWPNTKAFCDGYSEIIDTVREYQPKAAIYIMSILPVSAEVSAENKDCTNNEQIRKFNKMLQELAQKKDAIYLDAASVMADQDGNLPDGAAVDGIHPGSKYYQKWADYLEKNAVLPSE